MNPLSPTPADPWGPFAADPSEENFRALYEATKRLVWTLCVRILRNPVDASDAFQAAYCRLVALAKDPGRTAGSMDSTRFLCRIAIQEADSMRKRRARRSAREKQLGDEPPVQGREVPVEEALSRRELRERVEALVGTLPLPYRLPLELHFFHGLSQRDVARALDQPLSTVSERIRGALTKLAPRFRRAGLGEAGATLAGVAAAGLLLEPSLTAGVVFSRAAALSATLPAVPAGVSSAFLAHLLAGVAIMKTKAAAIAVVIVLLFAGALVSWEMRGRSDFEPWRAGVARVGAPGGGEASAPAGQPARGVPAAERSPVRVKVIWRTGAEPAGGATVTLSAARGLAAEAEGRTGEDGSLLLEAPGSWKSAWIEARHPEGVTGGSEVRLPAAQAITLSLRLDAITGVVVDSETGAPLPGAVVRLMGREAVADAAGAYLLAGPGLGLHEVRASAEGHAETPARVNHPEPGESVQDFRLDPAVPVLVTVRGEDGNPVPGARVTPSMFGSDGAFSLDLGVDTDALGRARIENLSRLHPPTIQASKDDYRSAYARPQTGPQASAAELTLVLEKIRVQGRVIAGRVADAQGQPIPGAIVEWKDGQGTSFGPDVKYGEFRAVADRNGRYRLEYVDDYDRCHLGVAAKGWAPVVSSGVRPGTPEAPAEVNFTLEPAHWLRGRVLDEESHPLANARLQVMPAKHLLNEAVAYPSVLRETKTDAEGRFELEDLPGPRAAVRLRYAGSPGQDLEVEVDREIELVVKGYGVIRGRVVDRESGEPVAAFRVRLRGSNSMEHWKPGLSFTSTDGRFAVTRLERDAVIAVIVEAEDYLPAEVEKLSPEAEGKAEEIVIRVARGSSVEGVVVDSESGAPIPGVQVGFTTTARPHEILEVSSINWEDFQLLPGLERTLTGEGGAFRFLEEKPATLILKDRKHQKRVIRPEDRAGFRGPDGRLRIPLERGERLNGVCHRDGHPWPGVTVKLDLVQEPARADGPPVLATHGYAKTDGDGRFVWSDLAPGSYLLEVERKINEPRPEFPVLVRRRVEVPGGGEASADLGSDLGGLTLRGRLTGLEGHVTMWANVVLRPLSGESGQEICLKTYRTWGFEYACPWLRPGKYAVEVQFYTKEGDRQVTLPPIDAAQDLERDLAVPALRATGE